ncbi:MAG: DUF4270 domain-containing protein [Bacteroidales bacterium]|jgi:hypothetical protein|nr:DUF4270 domain-containing protein [Bacteroidales bacterium]MDD3871031.1 DUF4270 domain-containing protein [Bacteroidales bacterium]NLO68902.1 DUF4270 domain-containing protein [Bacteroidales bacterium]
MIKPLVRRAVPVVVTAVIFLTLLLSACQNDEDLGFNLTPAGERFRFKIDSASTVTAVTLRQDSVTSDRREIVMLGSLNDPLFGHSTASLLTQVRLSSNDVNFGAGAQLDSAVLLLKYHHYYGDTTTPQQIRVFEMMEDIYPDTTYYSNLNVDPFFDESKPLADLTYLPQPTKDSLLIRLSDDIGTKILTADTSHLLNQTAFQEFFKGLYLQAQPTNNTGSIVYFNFGSGRSRMTLYYHNDEQDSLKYELVINTNGTWVGLFDHDYASSPLQPYINDSTSTHNQFYLQAMAGLRGYLKIDLSDSLTSMIESGIAINRAELIFNVDNTDPGIFSVPKSLRVFASTKERTNEYITDLALGENYYGGTLRNDSEYRFNIGRYVQDITYPVPSMRRENDGLLLVLTDERLSANRLILNANDIKLVVTYTPIN